MSIVTRPTSPFPPRRSCATSTIDMVHSFRQFVLEDEARKLFTFRGAGGIYRYKRLVMGNSPASSEAHKRVKMVVAGCEGVCQIKDDILVYGSATSDSVMCWRGCGRQA